MSVPDDAVTPTTDDVPDPVRATAPQADPAPDEVADPDGTGLPPLREAVLPQRVDGRGASGDTTQGWV